MTEAALLIAGLVQLIPLLGLSGAKGLHRLYGLELTDPHLILLLRHRAILLALVGVALLAAIAVPAWRTPAIALGLLSKLSFLALIAVSPKPNALITRVAKVDAITATLLVVAALLMQ